MLSALITSAARRSLLTLFLTHPGQRFYQSQIIRDTGLSSSLVQKELRRLADVGLLVSEREGNTRFFRVNTGFPLYSELKSIIYKTEGLGDVLRQSLGDVGEVKAALVYGSVAKNTEDGGSDVDVLVVGDVAPEALHGALVGAEGELGREVNATVFTVAEWHTRVTRRQAFATDVLAGQKIFLIGGEDDLR